MSELKQISLPRVKMEEMLREISNELVVFNDTQQTIEPGVMQGSIGQALFYAVLNQWSNNESYINEVSRHLKIVFDQLPTLNSIIFSDGLSGIGWTLIKMEELGEIELGIDGLLNQLDEVIPVFMLKAAEQGNYDFIMGAMGSALYCMARNTNRMNQAIVDFLDTLESTSVYSDGIRKWKKPFSDQAEEPQFDLGLCHGNASIIAFLLKCYEKGIEPERCKKMALEGIRYFLKIQQDPVENGCHWGNIVTEEELLEESRLAWCYGDAGIGLILLKASVLFKEEDLRGIANGVLTKTSQRRDLTNENINDTCLCHGSMGLALIFRKAHQLTGNPEYERVMSYWVTLFLEIPKHTDGIAGLKTLYGSGESAHYRSVSGILEGVSGVGLGLITLLDERFDDWQELLLF